jgi:hypothetical protein
MNIIFNTRNINTNTIINLRVPQIAGNFLTWWDSPGLFNMKLIFEVLINISSHCTNHCNNTCHRLHVPPFARLTDDRYGLYSFAGRVSTIQLTSLFPKHLLSPVPINFNPIRALSNVLYVQYRCTFSIFKKKGVAIFLIYSSVKNLMLAEYILQSITR